MPVLDRLAAAMCYASGTTGNPKGVVYSHRSIYLHSTAVASASGFTLTQYDRVLIAPSMFHAEAWGIPHAAGGWAATDPAGEISAGGTAGPTDRSGEADVRRRRARDLERPGSLCGKPSCRSLVLAAGDQRRSAVPRSLIERLQDRHGVRLIQIWG